MILKELINSVNYDEVWHVLDREYENGQGAYEAYKQVFEELQSLETNPGKLLVTLVVVKVKDSFEPGKFIFEVFGMEEGDENYYALEIVPWDEWINFCVLDKSIEIYGTTDVVAHALYAMTFFGYSAETVAKRVVEEKQILIKRFEEIRNGTVQLISHEEMMAEFDFIDKYTPEEREQQLKEYQRINAENEKIYKNLLSK